MAIPPSSHPESTVIDPVTMNDLTTRSYDPAFAEDDANVILRSSDATYYRVPSYTLRTTSRFFHDMMTLPQTNHQPDDEDVIVLDETSRVLGILLRMIGGLEFPIWQSFDDMEDFLNAVEKYDMPGPRNIARAYIISPLFLEQPLRLYVIAARYGWEEVAKFASKHTLSLSIHDVEHVALLERVPSSYLIRLFQLHRRRSDMFKANIKCSGNYFDIPVQSCGCSSATEESDSKNLARLADSMALQMYRQPSGEELLDSDGIWKVRPLFIGCSYCSNRIDVQEKIEKWITVCINSLPSTI